MPDGWGAHASVGNRTERRRGARSGSHHACNLTNGRQPAWRLLALDDEAAGERVGLDDALALPERRLEPAAAHPVLAPGSALHSEAYPVPQLAAVRCVAQLERALRIDVQPQLARHRLGAEMAVARAGARPVETSGRRLEFHLWRAPRCADDRVPADGVEPHRARRVLAARIA